MGTNIVFTPALQAPIGLMPSTGAVACVGNSSGGGAFAAVQPPQGALLFVTAAPSMALGVGTQAGAVGLAGQQAAVTQRAATLRNPAVGGVGLAGQAPVVAVTTSQLSANLIYSDNVKGPNWQGDASFGTGSAVNYQDTTHPQSGHTYSIAVPANTVWQPQSTNWDGSLGGGFGADISPYVGLQFDLWTANPTHQFDMQAHYDGIVVSGGQPVVAPTYLDNITEVVGTLAGSGWNTKLFIPSVVLGQLGNVVGYQFYIRDNNVGTVYLDNVQWVAGPFSWIYSGGQARTWNGSSYTRDPSTPFNGWSDASSNASTNYAQDPSGLSVKCGPTGLQNPSGTVAPVITDLWVAYQGQTAPGQATIGGTNNSSLFGSVDSMTLAWTSQPGSFPISGYNIYRSEDLFVTRVKLNSSLIPAGTTNYQDNTAVNCVATFCGGSTNPQSGAPALWWPARNYRYKVEAVDSQGTVGPLSATQKMYVYNFNSGGQNNPTINGNPAGGMKWGGDLGGGFELSYNDTGPNETGRAILVGDNAGYWLPTSGYIYPQWAKQVGGTDYFYIDINFAIVGGLTLHAELNPNDHKIDLLASAHAAPGNAPGNPSLDLTAYCYAVNGVVDSRWPNMPMSAIPTGVYCTFKVPRTHYMTDAGTLQNCVYKWLINKWGGSIGNGTRFDKIFYGP